jgi:hypothetical protein
MFTPLLLALKRQWSCAVDRLFIVCIAAGVAGGLCAAVLLGISSLQSQSRLDDIL